MQETFHDMSTNRRLEILRKFTEAHLSSPEILRPGEHGLKLSAILVRIEFPVH